MTCHAVSIELTPLQIKLSANAKVAVSMVRNAGTEESVMQVTLNKWTLDGERYAYAQSQELVFTPATFRLAPGKQQIVRVSLLAGPPAANENSYRLLVEEVPPPPSPNVTQTRLVVRHDLPVFVMQTEAPKLALDISLDCAVDGARLRLTNTGNVHTRLHSVVLHGTPVAQVLGSWDTFDYLLPNARKSWGLAQVAPTAVGKTFQVTALTDRGSFTADVANKCS